MMEKLKNVRYANNGRKIIDSMQTVARNERNGNICVLSTLLCDSESCVWQEKHYS